MPNNVKLNIDGFNIEIEREMGFAAEGRIFAIAKINGFSIPYYQSTGLAGKEDFGIPKGFWYATPGVSHKSVIKGQKGDWVNKGSTTSIATQWGSSAYQAGAKAMAHVFGTQPYLETRNVEAKGWGFFGALLGSDPTKEYRVRPEFVQNGGGFTLFQGETAPHTPVGQWGKTLASVGAAANPGIARNIAKLGLPIFDYQNASGLEAAMRNYANKIPHNQNFSLPTFPKKQINGKLHTYIPSNWSFDTYSFTSTPTPTPTSPWEGFQDFGGWSLPGGVAPSKGQQYLSHFNADARKAAARAAATDQNVNSRQRRLKELEHFTTPNMRGYFPDASPGKKSKVLTFFDTETDDRSRILTIAAHKVVYNYDKGRFENADSDPGFFRVYNPPNVDSNIARTEGKHGLFAGVLNLMRRNTGAHYSETWDKSQYEDFKNWVGDSELAGHNIVAADIPWILRAAGRDFNQDTYKKGFFDTLHFAKAITGKGQSAALQELRARYGVNDGLRGHEADSDVVANIKVVEEMIRRNPNSEFVAEILYAMGMKGVQTHWKEGLNLEEGIGQIIHGARGKPLYNLPYVGAKKGFGKYVGFEPLNEKQVVDLRDTFDIPQEAYETAGGAKGFVLSNYEEGRMADDTLDMSDYRTVFERIKELMDRRGEMKESLTRKDDAWKNAVKAARTFMPKTGAGWNDAIIDLSKHDKDITAALRLAGYNPSVNDLYDTSTTAGHAAQAIARDALIANRSDWYKQQEKYVMKAGQMLAADKSEYSKLSWWKKLDAKDVEDISPVDIDAYKTAKKKYINKKKTKEAEARQEAKDEEQFRSKLSHAKYEASVEENQWRAKHEAEKTAQKEKDAKRDAAIHAENLANKLKKLKEQEAASAQAAEKLWRANKLWNPMSALKNIASQSEAIQQAAHGILPSFAEKPLMRTYSAYQNIFSMMSAGVQDKWNKGSIIADTLSGAGIATGNPYLLGAGGLLKAGSQLVGSDINRKITQTGQGIAARLNLLGAVNELVLAPLRLFNRGISGTVNLFKKLSNVWGQMYGFPLTNLTSISSAHYGNMTGTDRLMGFQQGATNSMHNSFSNQQVQMYSRGQFDENRLVASALLGVFDSVYAPMGGNTEEQMASTINHIHHLIKSDPANKQRYMGLAASIHPEYQSILQRMSDLGVNDYRDFNNGKFRSSLGVRFSNIREGEREAWAKTAYGWSESMRGVSYNLHRIAQPLWTKVGRPVMNSVNEALETVAQGMSGDISWGKVKDKVVKIFTNLWKEISENLGLGNIKIEVAWDKIRGWISKALMPFMSVAANGLLDAFNWLGHQISGGIADLIDYLGAIKFDTDPRHIYEAFQGKRTLDSLISMPEDAYNSRKEYMNPEKQATAFAYTDVDAFWEGNGQTNSYRLLNGIFGKDENGNYDLGSAFPEAKGWKLAVKFGHEDEAMAMLASIQANRMAGATYTPAQTYKIIEPFLDNKNFKVFGDEFEQAQTYTHRKVDANLDGMINRVAKPILREELGAFNKAVNGMDFGTVRLIAEGMQVASNNLSPALQKYATVTQANGATTLTIGAVVPKE